MTDDGSGPEGMSRREWAKLGLAIAGGAAAAATGFTFISPLLRGPGTNREIRDTIVYRRFPSPQWWNDRDGEPIRVTDLGEWQGALGRWNGTYVNGEWIDETGFPVLVIRVKRDDSVFTAPQPSELALPAGEGICYDDPARDIRIVVVYDRSTHLCCYPGWHTVMDPPPTRDYIAPCPTYELYGLDPIYDVCHGGQWDPLALEWATNPRNKSRYIGARMVRGPGFGPLPIVPVRAVQDALVGRLLYPTWYEYC